MFRVQKEGKSAHRPFPWGGGLLHVDIFLNFFLDFSAINHGHTANAMYPNTIVFTLTVCCVSNCGQFF